jgi:hypothetical protein
MTENEDVMAKLPIACNLTSADLAKRGDEIERELFQFVEEVRELSDGFAYRFPANDPWPRKALVFIEDERKCCPFFTFELLFEPGEGPMWLHLRGGEGVKEFIQVGFNSTSE